MLPAYLLLLMAVTTHVGQVRVLNRAEGALIAVDEGGDGRIDHIYIAEGVKIAVGFSGRAMVESSETYVRVTPEDGTAQPLQYTVGRDHPAWAMQRAYRSVPVRGLVHYEGEMVHVPFDVVDSWDIPNPTGKEPETPRLFSLSSFGKETGPYVGQTRVISRDGYITIAVDDNRTKDGIVDVIVVAQAEQAVEPFQGEALVEVTEAGVRLVVTEPKLRTLFFVRQPKAIQTRSGQQVAVPLDSVESLDLEPQGNAAIQAAIRELERKSEPRKP